MQPEQTKLQPQWDRPSLTILGLPVSAAFIGTVGGFCGMHSTPVTDQ